MPKAECPRIGGPDRRLCRKPAKKAPRAGIRAIANGQNLAKQQRTTIARNNSGLDWSIHAQTRVTLKLGSYSNQDRGADLRRQRCRQPVAAGNRLNRLNRLIPAFYALEPCGVNCRARRPTRQATPATGPVCPPQQPDRKPTYKTGATRAWLAMRFGAWAAPKAAQATLDR
jgi:hypothetical protein